MDFGARCKFSMKFHLDTSFETSISHGYHGVTWVQWRPGSTAKQLFVRQFVQTNKKENISSALLNLFRGIHLRKGNIMTSSNGNISALLALCVGNSPVTGEFPSQSQSRGALMFSLICAWTNGWVNTRNADDLRRHRAHYDVTVMMLSDHQYYSRSCVILFL